MSPVVEREFIMPCTISILAYKRPVSYVSFSGIETIGLLLGHIQMHVLLFIVGVGIWVGVDIENV